MQADPISPTLKAPGTKPLKLQCDMLLSTSAFKFNLRRYDLESTWGEAALHDPTLNLPKPGGLLVLGAEPSGGGGGTPPAVTVV